MDRFAPHPVPPPLQIGLLFVLNYLSYHFGLSQTDLSVVQVQPLNELKEMNYAAVFTLLAFYFFYKTRHEKPAPQTIPVVEDRGLLHNTQ